MSDVLRTNKVKVRKHHRCGSCDASIRKGDMATVQVVVDQSNAYSIYACTGCEALFEKFHKELFGSRGDYELHEWAIVELLEQNEEARTIYRQHMKKEERKNEDNTNT